MGGQQTIGMRPRAASSISEVAHPIDSRGNRGTQQHMFKESDALNHIPSHPTARSCTQQTAQYHTQPQRAVALNRT